MSSNSRREAVERSARRVAEAQQRREMRQLLEESSIGQANFAMAPYYCTSHLTFHIPDQATQKCFGCDKDLAYDRSMGRWADWDYFKNMSEEELGVKRITLGPQPADDDGFEAGTAW
jgi:hypothetical protein